MDPGQQELLSSQKTRANNSNFRGDRKNLRGDRESAISWQLSSRKLGLLQRALFARLAVFTVRDLCLNSSLTLILNMNFEATFDVLIIKIKPHNL